MRAVVLVGGEGTRLRPLTWTTPKQMLPVAGRPMIGRVVAHLGAHGVDEVVLSLGYRPSAFTAAYPAGRIDGVALHYAVEPEPLGTAGAIAFAARHAGVGETFLVVNGDVLTDLDVSALIGFHRVRGAEATISLTAVEDPSAFGVVPTDGDGRVVAFIEKPPRDEAPTNLINGGTYVCEPSVLDRIPAGRKVSVERETFPDMVPEGNLYALASPAPWSDVGTPERYLHANLAIGARSGTGPGVDPAATVVDAVIGAGSRVDAKATVERSVLLDGVHVSVGATVRDSIIGRGSLIGERAVVAELSVLGDGVQVGPGQEVVGERIPRLAT